MADFSSTTNPLTYFPMKTKLRASFFALLVIGLSGCVTPPPPIDRHRPVQAPFNAEDFAPYAAGGAAKISGQAFLRTRGGDVKYAAGAEVTITPATPYLKEVRDLRDAGFIPIGHEGEKTKAIAAATKTTIADGGGNFEFNGLAAGEYLIETEIYWSTGYRETGGLVHKYVTVKDGEAVKVIVTE